MATPALRLLLNNSKASLRLIRGSSLSRSGVGSAKDQGLLASAQLLGRVHFQEPPRVDFDVLMGAQGPVSVLGAGRSRPVFDMGAAQSYCRGRAGAEIPDNDKVDSDKDSDDDGDLDDDVEGFDSDDVRDVGEDINYDYVDSEDEKPGKWEWRRF